MDLQGVNPLPKKVPLIVGPISGKGYNERKFMHSSIIRENPGPVNPQN
jgi:hypothetical protein